MVYRGALNLDTPIPGMTMAATFDNRVFWQRFESAQASVSTLVRIPNTSHGNLKISAMQGEFVMREVRGDNDEPGVLFEFSVDFNINLQGIDVVPDAMINAQLKSTAPKFAEQNLQGYLNSIRE